MSRGTKMEALVSNQLHIKGKLSQSLCSLVWFQRTSRLVLLWRFSQFQTLQCFSLTPNQPKQCFSAKFQTNERGQCPTDHLSLHRKIVISKTIFALSEELCTTHSEIILIGTVSYQTTLCG